MIYKNFISTPKGRRTMGQIQFFVIFVGIFLLEINNIGFEYMIEKFFMPGPSIFVYDESYRKSVYFLAGSVQAFMVILAVITGVRGFAKMKTASLAGTSEADQFKGGWWSALMSMDITSSNGRTNRPGLERHDNINSIIDYVEGKNMTTDRQGAAENYGAISSIGMMDKSTRDYVNGRLGWMDRKSGFEYIKGLGDNKK